MYHPHYSGFVLASLDFVLELSLLIHCFFLVHNILYCTYCEIGCCNGKPAVPIVHPITAGLWLQDPDSNSIKVHIFAEEARATGSGVDVQWMKALRFVQQLRKVPPLPGPAQIDPS